MKLTSLPCVFAAILYGQEFVSACETTPGLTYESGTLSNRFTCLTIDGSLAIKELGGSLLGNGEDSGNVIAYGGIAPMLIKEEGAALGLKGEVKLEKSSSNDKLVVSISTTSDDVEGYADTQLISLGKDDRYFSFETTTIVPQGGLALRSFPFVSSSTTAFYESGPVQMKDGVRRKGCFASEEKLSRVYR